MDLVWRGSRRPGRLGLAQRSAVAHAPARSPTRAGDHRPIGGPLMTRRLLFAATLLIGIGGAPAYAVEPSERLADPALEARARALSQELRCLVCQNQSIDESNADLAH